MLTENDVVQKIVEYLKNEDYTILQSLTTSQARIDVIAENQFEKIHIEAKDETSSYKSSKRFGLPFNRKQVKTHISVALLATMKVISNPPDGSRTKVGLALPETKEQKEIISKIKTALNKLEIRIYWVNQRGVKIE